MALFQMSFEISRQLIFIEAIDMKAASLGPRTIFSLGASGHHTAHADETVPGRRVVGLVRRLRPVSLFTSEVFPGM